VAVGHFPAAQLKAVRRQWEKRMSIKCSVYIAASVDGFIARPDGDIEWLHKVEYTSPDKLSLSYDEFIATVDGLIMGRKSFEKVLSFSSWPYEDVPVIVLSSEDIEISDDLRGKVKVDRGNPIDIVSRLESAGNKHLYIDGGATIQRFLQSGLINEITVTQIPVILGAGIPLFGSINVEKPLKHVETTSSSNGFVQSRYKILNDA
jgi:dihydrofolate reductase